LDTRWTPKANAFLVQFGLRVEVFVWVTRDDKGNATPHLAIQLFRYNPAMLKVPGQAPVPIPAGATVMVVHGGAQQQQQQAYPLQQHVMGMTPPGAPMLLQPVMPVGAVPVAVPAPMQQYPTEVMPVPQYNKGL